MKEKNDYNVAVNVYRTEKYIVEQSLYLKINEVERNILFSFDKYYFRTRNRDRIFERKYRKRRIIDGMRIKTTMYSRTYL